MQIPTSTYRLQFRPGFGFPEASNILSYLLSLGIGAIYASPIFAARPGSQHGYDVVDPGRINPELGSEQELMQLIHAVRDGSMGWVQDIVPNHMAFAWENQMLMEVLEHRQRSRYFSMFDIDWEHPYPGLHSRVLAPFLGQLFGQALEQGVIKLDYSEQGFFFAYYEHKLPLSLDSYAWVLTQGLQDLKKELSEEHPDFINLLGGFYVLKTLPQLEDPQECLAQAKFAKKLLFDLYSRNRQIHNWINTLLQRINNQLGWTDSFQTLDQLLEMQYFKLSYWKLATEEINYRRFFNVNELICLRMQDDIAFRHVHQLPLDLLRQGLITGLRIDHVDGLLDPAGYLHKLRSQAPGAGIWVEKILEARESLPRDWPVQGSTGYDFLNRLNQLFVESKNFKLLQSIYSAYTSQSRNTLEISAKSKRLILEKEMAGELQNVARLLHEVFSSYRHGRDISFNALHRALQELLVYFPVYRTYFTEQSFSEQDWHYLHEALGMASQANPDLELELSLLQHFFSNQAQDQDQQDRGIWIKALMRLQQLSGPLAAKGFEDTTLYVSGRLLSLNEVGGNPDSQGLSRQKLHQFLQQRAKLWPGSMSCTSTHDCKRGEDMRARLNVLSELASQWQEKLKSWSKMNSRRRPMLQGKRVPDRNEEYCLYQTLLGTMPFLKEQMQDFPERIEQYLIKALREAKVHSDWINPNIEYEQACIKYLRRLLQGEHQDFWQDFIQFQAKVAYLGIFNSLAQTLLKLTAPGVPDLYQGTEFWDLSLVDPDNRRPVDFESRQKVLHKIQDREKQSSKTLLQELLQNLPDPSIKLFVLYKALGLRKELPELFLRGEYIQIQSYGQKARHVFAFARRLGNTWVLVAVPRLPSGLIRAREVPLGRQAWEDTSLELPEHAPDLWTDIFCVRSLSCAKQAKMAELCQEFPLLLLKGESQSC
ncbi:MAG: malto-oligosyltrehalose synthase [Desulfohalobiaceae bacterium]